MPRRHLRPPQLRLQRIPQQLLQHRHRHVAPGPLEIPPLRRLPTPTLQPRGRPRRNPRPSRIPPRHRPKPQRPLGVPSRLRPSRHPGQSQRPPQLPNLARHPHPPPSTRSPCPTPTRASGAPKTTPASNPGSRNPCLNPSPGVEDRACPGLDPGVRGLPP